MSDRKNLFLSFHDSSKSILIIAPKQYSSTNAIPTINGITNGWKPDGIRSIINLAEV